MGAIGLGFWKKDYLAAAGAGSLAGSASASSGSLLMPLIGASSLEAESATAEPG
jgi:hypothetical protein